MLRSGIDGRTHCRGFVKRIPHIIAKVRYSRGSGPHLANGAQWGNCGGANNSAARPLRSCGENCTVQFDRHHELRRRDGRHAARHAEAKTPSPGPRPRRFLVRASRGDLLPPSPPAKKANARQDQARQASTDDGGGADGYSSKSNLRYVPQPNCTCERYARDLFTARRRKREEILSTPTERK